MGLSWPLFLHSESKYLLNKERHVALGVTRLIAFASYVQVAAFQCLQPFVGAVLAFAVLGEEPSIWDVGAIGVIAGLVLVAKDPTETTAMLSKIKRIVSQTSLVKS